MTSSGVRHGERLSPTLYCIIVANMPYLNKIK
jgi:hypothetical protein